MSIAEITTLSYTDTDHTNSQ